MRCVFIVAQLFAILIFNFAYFPSINDFVCNASIYDEMSSWKIASTETTEIFDLITIIYSNLFEKGIISVSDFPYQLNYVNYLKYSKKDQSLNLKQIMPVDFINTGLGKIPIKKFVTLHSHIKNIYKCRFIAGDVYINQTNQTNQTTKIIEIEDWQQISENNTFLNLLKLMEESWNFDESWVIKYKYCSYLVEPSETIEYFKNKFSFLKFIYTWDY